MPIRRMFGSRSSTCEHAQTVDRQRGPPIGPWRQSFQSASDFQRDRDGVMPEWRDDLHADRPPVGMRPARNADAWQPRGVHPGATFPCAADLAAPRPRPAMPAQRRGDQRVEIPPRSSTSARQARASSASTIRGGRNRKTTFNSGSRTFSTSRHASRSGTGPSPERLPPRSAWRARCAERRGRTGRKPRRPHNSRSARPPGPAAATLAATSAARLHHRSQ